MAHLSGSQSSKSLAPVPSQWSPFVIDSSYQFVATLSFSNTQSVAARHSSGEICRIQKYTAVGSNVNQAKACLKELRLLRHLRAHKNITCAYDMDITNNNNGIPSDVYLYTELPKSSLAALISKGKTFSKSHVQFILYQVLCAVNHVHSAGVIHGRVCPENILVNPNTTIRLSGFSGARAFSEPIDPPSTRASGTSIFYQAPELVLGAAKTSFPIDIWSVGCILAELLNGKPIFDRKDLPGQIRLLIGSLGTPSEEALSKIASAQTAHNLRMLPRQAAPQLSQLSPNSDGTELHMLQQTLAWDPGRRSKPSTLLNSAYFTQWRRKEDEAVSHKVFTSGFRSDITLVEVSHMIMAEVSSFREYVRLESQGTRTIHSSLIKRPYICKFGNYDIYDSATREKEPSIFWFAYLHGVNAYSARSAHSGNDDGNGLDVGDEDGDFEWDDDR